MKAFYSETVTERSGGGDLAPSLYIGTRARVAVYDDIASAPYVEDVTPAPIALPDRVRGIEG